MNQVVHLEQPGPIRRPIVTPFRPDRLASLAHICLASIGPKARLCLMETSSGLVRATSTSDRIVMSLEPCFSDPCAKAVLQFAQSHLKQWHDGGLTFLALVCNLASVLQHDQADAEQHAVSQLIRRSLLECSIKVDVSSMSQMLAVIKSILCSKPLMTAGGPTCKADFLKKVAVQILQGFLCTIPSDESVSASFDLGLIVEPGSPDDIQLQQGYFHSCPDLPAGWRTFQARSSASASLVVVALNVQLKTHLKDLSEMLDCTLELNSTQQRSIYISHLTAFADFCADHNVDVVVNQKVVDVDTEQLFRQRGILIIGRLGRQGIQKVVQMAGMQVMLENLGVRLSAGQVLGSLDCIEEVKIGQQRFLRFLKHEASSCVTLVIHHWNQDSCEETKLLYERCINALYSILSHPHILPGAGCTEAILYRALLQAAGTSTGLMRQFANALAHHMAALHAVSLDGCLTYDNSYGHLWLRQEDGGYGRQQRCRCGMVGYEEHFKFGMISALHADQVDDAPTCGVVAALMPADDADFIVDLKTIREHALLGALQAALAMSSIGSVITI